MLIVYASKTGNVNRFIHKLDHEHILRISDGNEQVSEPFILITYTTGIGEVPKEVASFCEINGHLLQGIIASGNRNWGGNYGISGDKLSTKYGVPVLHKFEMSGRGSDVIKVIERIEEYEIS